MMMQSFQNSLTLEIGSKIYDLPLQQPQRPKPVINMREKLAINETVRRLGVNVEDLGNELETIAEASTKGNGGIYGIN